MSRSSPNGAPVAERKDVGQTGDMARRIHALDWSRTPLGPMDSWSPALRMKVTFLLANRFPLLLWWGPRFVGIYNDAYRPILGAKHPRALGQPAAECWHEIWHILRPLIERPFQGGASTWMEDILLEVRRHGYAEETHFTIAYSPVPDETAPRGIGGVLATVHEITDKVIAERRALALRDFGMRGLEAKTAEEACLNAAAALRPHSRDVPFALMYLLDADRRQARLAAAVGAEARDPVCPTLVRLDHGHAPWPFRDVLEAEELKVVGGLGGRFSRVPPGPWSDPPDSAAVVPVRSNLARQLAGFFVIGLSSRSQFDAKYRGFVELMGTQLATAIANARACEEEARRAAALAELDRAKTTFFSNVSHEFRTPLALMLGPLEQAIRESAGPREVLEIAHRNSLRLLKLVNSLLDFSRLEAGRVEAIYEATDLAALTAELASPFRAAIEKAGLELTVSCPPLSGPAYVDRDMWEKIVFNLLSNAFKFTFAGGITVQLEEFIEETAGDGGRAPGGRCARLVIRDTGTGISPGELPRVFERFHRVRNARSRSREGAGIGLALVQELVRLHGGRVAVASEAGRGTVFTVSIPLGAAHLPQDRVKRTFPDPEPGARPSAEDAPRWLPDPSAGEPGRPQEAAPPPAPDLEPDRPSGKEPGARIVLADDNNDMREYLRRLLVEHGYEVATAANGVAALELVRSFEPALVLSDVMMPRLDGFGFLQALRAAPETKTLPVILLTARAGEEARIEGATAGADDYLTKPFGARELLARMETHLQLARLRRENASTLEAQRRHLRAVVDNTPECVTLVGADGTLLDINDSGLAMTEAENRESVIGKSVYGLIAPEDRARFREFNEQVCQGAKGRLEFDIVSRRGTRRHLEARATPLQTSEWGQVHLGLTRDVTEQRRLADAQRVSEERFRAFVTASSDVVYRMNADWTIMSGLEGKAFIADQAAPSREWLTKYIHPEDQAAMMAKVGEAIRHRKVFELEHRVIRMDGTPGWAFSRAVPLLDKDGEVVEWFGAATDVTARHKAAERLQEVTVRSEQQRRLYDTILSSTPDLVYVFDREHRFTYANRALLTMWGRSWEAAIGKTCLELGYEPWHAAMHGREIEQVVATRRPIRGVVPFTGVQGQRICDYIFVPVFGSGGEVEAVAGTTRDITELKQNENALRFLVDLSAATQALSTPDDILATTARLLYEHLGVDRCAYAEIENESVLVITGDYSHRVPSIVGRWPLRAFGAECTRCMLANEPYVVGDTDTDERIAPADLAAYRATNIQALICVPLHKENRLTAAMAVNQATPRAWAPEEIELVRMVVARCWESLERARTLRSLEQTVADRTLRLRETIAELEAFSYSIAHDLRAPLRSLQGFAEVLLEDHLSRLDEAGQGHLRRIATAGRRMDRLVQDVLDYSRVVRDHSPLGPVDLGRLLREIVDTYPMFAPEAVAVEFESVHATVLGNEAMLTQVFSNLLGNAVKFVAPGVRPHVRVTAQDREKNVRISVRDNGIGIDPGQHEKIFEIFQQAAVGYGGTGIGLAIVKKAVERMGGAVGVNSAPGQGSEFWIELPRERGGEP